MGIGWLTPRAVVRPAGDKGVGVVATDAIEAGELVAAFGGTIVTTAEMRALPDWQRHLTMQIDDDLFVTSAEPDDPPDAINHACDPNCGFRGEMTLVAMRAIAPGEEVTFDSAMCDSTAFDEFVCACGSVRCRGEVRADAWSDPQLQLRYNGYFSPYLAARIAAAAALA